MAKPLELLTEQGVSVWCDSIARDWLEKGELRRLEEQFCVVGVTSNPTIFEKAMGEGSFYDDQLQKLAKQGLAAPEIFEAMALDDIRAAAKDLEGIFERTNRRDGYVSYELGPDLASDTEASVRDARRLFDTLALPNVFIKIPATAAGVDAIRRSIAGGINVNVTLIFSIARYREVMEAYLSGLEELAESGGDLETVGSVASFFVSRVDTNVDPKLQELVDGGGAHAERARGRLGTAAIDNAKLAYEAFEQTFSGPRWEALARRGAGAQRPLWASTSSKNKAYRDVVYCEELIADHSVNTMPLATIEAFADHGEVRGQTIKEDLERAHSLWSDLAELGIDEDEVGRELEEEGVAKFAESFSSLLETVDAKRAEAAR